MRDLNSKVKQLAAEREELATLRRRANELRAEIDESEIGRELKETIAAVKAMEDGETVTYAELCADALAAYNETGETKPHEAVTVKMYTTLVYGQDMARNWAIEHNLPNLLKLDTRSFEALAKVSPPYFVVNATEPKATVSRDLSKWM